jgi:hypothetical protein
MALVTPSLRKESFLIAVSTASSTQATLSPWLCSANSNSLTITALWATFAELPSEQIFFNFVLFIFQSLLS